MTSVIYLNFFLVTFLSFLHLVPHLWQRSFLLISRKEHFSPKLLTNVDKTAQIAKYVTPSVWISILICIYCGQLYMSGSFPNPQFLNPKHLLGADHHLGSACYCLLREIMMNCHKSLLQSLNYLLLGEG